MIWYVVAADEQQRTISIYLPGGPATERLEAIGEVSIRMQCY